VGVVLTGRVEAEGAGPPLASDHMDDAMSTASVGSLSSELDTFAGGYRLMECANLCLLLDVECGSCIIHHCVR